MRTNQSEELPSTLSSDQTNAAMCASDIPKDPSADIATPSTSAPFPTPAPVVSPLAPTVTSASAPSLYVFHNAENPTSRTRTAGAMHTRPFQEDGRGCEATSPGDYVDRIMAIGHSQLRSFPFRQKRKSLQIFNELKGARNHKSCLD
jgi:hypothetical protein